jgi:catechol 2,3-dioxygenase-like lactoylglutathione lyase family enzyme
MSDRGLTHVALLVSDVEASLAFYAAYAGMQTVHDRTDATTGARVAWITDRTRPFVIVLVQAPGVAKRLVKLLGRITPGVQHLGVGCASREEVDRLCAAARRDGRLRSGPTDSGHPVGYWAFINDPDGHILEVSFGQEVGLTVERSGDVSAGAEGRR